MSGALLVENIGELLTVSGDPRDRLGLVHDAALYLQDGRVVFAGAAGALDRTALGPKTARLDARGALVTPGLVDPHTHPIFAGSRAHEFDLRVQGKGYLEIQHAGGGILSTVRATRQASDEALVASTLARLDRFLEHGVTTIEAKSGYDLTIDGELRLLGLLGEARRRHPCDLSPTLLAHVPPSDEDRAAFLARFCERAIPEAARRGLAEAVDVYCDAGAFTLDETRAILEAALGAGLLLRVHAEQFSATGAAELGAELGARSVEHLEQLSPKAPALLARAGTICNLLPGAALTLKLPWPDARRLLSAGCRVALGTDCNPGSSLTESLPLMMSLAATQMGMSCEECWLAVTREAAHAVNRPDAGRLTQGARGDFVIWETDDHRELVQHLGGARPRVVAIGGELVVEDRRRVQS